MANTDEALKYLKMAQQFIDKARAELKGLGGGASPDDEMIDIGIVECVADSPKAICVTKDGDELWLPRSQLGTKEQGNTVFAKGDEGTCVITEWIAKQKGLM